MSEVNNEEMRNNLQFVKEIAKYFMDFLETDFHKRKNPKRSIQFQNKNNLRIGINLNKYNSFNKLVLKLIPQVFNKNIKLKKGKYKINIPINLLDIIKYQTENITEKQINIVLNKINNEVKKNCITYQNNFEQAFTTILENISLILKENLVLPFVNQLEIPLEKLELGDENSIYLMEEELTSVLISLIENKILDIVKRSIIQEKINIKKELEPLFALDEIRSSINIFFDNFKVSDLFQEVYEIERNSNILDKQELYLYFCDIKFNKIKYPIFYIPFVIHKEFDVMNIEFDSQVYINKKALEFIIQEYNQENGKKGNLQTITERIIYLAHCQNNFSDVINEILNEIVNFLELDNNIDISIPESQVSKSFWTRITNSCYIVLFDKSDEALLNDYEDILQKINENDSILVSAFNKLIKDFIHNNPKPYNPEIEDEWDEKETSDKLVFKSPIPLNGEQLQILSALRKKDCKYITVEGPPGTGKSHTITAVVFNAIRDNQSVLVLSDKKEALDVVEDKITTTMNNVRHDKKFQNPILRLGKTGNTYNKILSTSSIDNIKTHHRAIKNNYKNLENDIIKIEKSIKEDIDAEIYAYEEIEISEILELYKLENYLSEKQQLSNIEELIHQSESAIELEEFRNIYIKIRSMFQDNSPKIIELFSISINDILDLKTLMNLIEFLESVNNNYDLLKESFPNNLLLLSYFKELSNEDYNKLNLIIEGYKIQHNWLFGYFFNKKKVAKLNYDFRKIFPNNKFEFPQKEINNFEKVIEILEHIIDLNKTLKSLAFFKPDYIKTSHSFYNQDEYLNSLIEVISLKEDIEYLIQNQTKYKNYLLSKNIDINTFSSFMNNDIINMDEKIFKNLIRYFSIQNKIQHNFNNIPEINFIAQNKKLQDLVTTQMTYIMDSRLVKFYDYNKSDARTLRGIIRKKERFPRNEFSKLKEAFPCILAGIRDYAEFIPLEPEIFDLIIIDESSQVSIAQAFPALLRAKKVLVLGDKKQFSNVKSAQARTITNISYLNNLKHSFKQNVSNDEMKLERLNKFNIKTSILEFFEFITNYHIQLRKHFRGYKEIISYSNEFFYENKLEVMKIRGKPINDVIKFSFVKKDFYLSEKHNKDDMTFSFINPDELSKTIHNTNINEVYYIISELKKMKDLNDNSSVGIITPHTNQQKLLMEKISKQPERDYFFEKLHLKIMTFDTCQGEERDIIFYSMVATDTSDRLWGVFIKDLSNVDLEEEGKIKAQRLNVGFSRAKECIHFVLSKSLDNYNGSIGEALRHYKFILDESVKERSISEVDKNSKMEPVVMNWFYQTNFWKINKDNITFIPQFEIGKYLKQLDGNYTHPNYKVDFLLIYKDNSDIEHKIIIEYDGFKEHFTNLDEVNEFNYQNYYNNDDVYREKVLEGYGYKFLRINKFNIGKEPIKNLNKRIENIVKPQKLTNNILTDIHNTIDDLENGDMKECPKCNKLRTIEEFRDDSLITGYGRFCVYCKGISYRLKNYKSITDETKKDKTCPKCGSKMLIRNGRYGKFYGCSKYPYCKGTRPYD